MAKKKDQAKDVVSEKKLNRLLIEQRLETAFAELKPVIGKKKFDKRMKKAVKMIYNGFPKKAVDSWRKLKASDKETTEIKEQTQHAINDLP